MTTILPAAKQWQRLEHDGRIIYIQPESPDWLAPTAYGDLLLQALLSSENLSAASLLLQQRLAQTDLAVPGNEHRLALDLDRLALSLKSADQPDYRGRGRELSLERLKECWFHLTDRCNLSCRHCLFASSPAQTRTLPQAQLDQATHQALELGCRLFYFTGGEPFVYPGFFPWLTAFLARNPESHGVILTNGMLLDNHIATLPALDRLHLQISLDGLEAAHDRLRGPGSYQRLLASLSALRRAGKSFTLSIAVSRANVADLPALMTLANELGAASVHLLYHFIRGKGNREQFVPPAGIFPHLLAAWERADACGLTIDNLETIRGQVFSTPGTRHDLTNSGWESLTLGPDGVIYPSPALVGLAGTACGMLAQGLDTVWRTSPILNSLRQASLLDSPHYRDNPLKFIIGGGDPDHSFLTGGHWMGHDPYIELYDKIALELIKRQADLSPVAEFSPIKLRMGDIRHDCPDPESAGRGVTLTHCNCVISLASDTSDHGRWQVREFYGQAAVATNEDIVNPLAEGQSSADYIPEDSRKRSYGCGSPVTDADPRPGQTLVDLGSGSGVECFMAAAAVGSQGQVFGIDMTDAMLHLAESSKQEVAARLGYDNVEFRKGFLEEIPLDDQCADIVISNCVINLSPDKRKTYREIHRILKPGGKLVISDITTDAPIPAAIKNNVLYRGECLGGAMQQEELVELLTASGFAAVRLIKRFPYRQVDGMDFFSLTYQAQRPEQPAEVEKGRDGGREAEPSLACGRSCAIPGARGTGPSLACGRSRAIPGARDTKPSLAVVYRGPYAAVTTESGILLVKGRRTLIPDADAQLMDDSVFLLDEDGAVTNLVMTNSCCALPPSSKAGASANATADTGKEELARQSSGCMVCGAVLRYFTESREMVCRFCGRAQTSNACCESGHFVCDRCHQEQGIEVIRSICATTKEQDMLALLQLLRSHPSIPMHGPEHHALIPGIFLACYRNCGGDIDSKEILTGINRGTDVPGGVCGFWGACGAAIGIGIGVSVILEATPLTPGPRQLAQEFTGRILTLLAGRKGGRCCQRETWIALTEAARLSAGLLSIPLRAEAALHCDQYPHNKECIRKQCPLWEQRVRLSAPKAIPMAF